MHYYFLKAICKSQIYFKLIIYLWYVPGSYSNFSTLYAALLLTCCKKILCFFSLSVEQAYVNQRKLETEAKQLQAHAGTTFTGILKTVRKSVFLWCANCAHLAGFSLLYYVFTGKTHTIQYNTIFYYSPQGAFFKLCHVH